MKLNSKQFLGLEPEFMEFERNTFYKSKYSSGFRR